MGSSLSSSNSVQPFSAESRIQALRLLGGSIELSRNSQVCFTFHDVLLMMFSFFVYGFSGKWFISWKQKMFGKGSATVPQTSMEMSATENGNLFLFSKLFLILNTVSRTELAIIDIEEDKNDAVLTVCN